MKKIILIALFFLTASSCNTTPAPQSTSTPIVIAPMPGASLMPAPPFDASSIVSTPNPIPKGLPQGPQIKFGIEDKSIVTTPDDGGQAGTFIKNENLQGIYALNSAYPTIGLNPTSSTSTFNALYAPTTKLGGGCLELSMDYWIYGKGPEASGLRLYDFCGPGWNTGINIPIDSTFQTKYLRDFGAGLMYTMEIFGKPGSSWRVFLYNYNLNKWDLLYTSQPGNNTYNDSDSWSMTESHFSPGPCSNFIHPILSLAIQIYNGSQWNTVGDNDIVGSLTPWGQCFTGTNPSYTLQFISKYSNWLVTSNFNE